MVYICRINSRIKNQFMATAKKAAPKIRDYKAERERTKQNKLKKQAEGTNAQPEPEQPRKAAPKPAAAQVIDPGQCGHVMIALSQIISDPNQPRKFFDMEELKGLSQSIVQHGVIQPITVRPIPGGLFMVVCGDRRFRASLIAQEAGNNITEIPAMIRELTDAEALEIQLTENLQRHNPHPIEDAHSFKIMLANNYSIEDIALKVCKSEKFVAMRLMLNDLSPAFQEVFFAGKMSLGQAVMLCKVAAEAQDAIFADEVPDNWKEDADFMLDDVEHLVKRESKNLDSAPFKTEDPDLYKEMGACGGCKFNSANNLVLFTDANTSRICGNAVCYNIKCSRSYKQSIEQVMSDPSVVFVAAGHYSDTDKQKVKDVEKLGVAVLPAGTWKRVILKKPDWNEHLADNEDNFDPEEETWEQFEQNVRTEYDQMVTSYEEELKKVEAARTEGKIRKAFVVAGNCEGTIVEIMPTTEQAEIALTGGPGSDRGVEHEIEEIKKREARAKELDGEKIWLAVRDEMSKGQFLAHGGAMDPVERCAMAAAIFEAIGWSERKEFALEVLKLKQYEDGMKVAKALEKITDEQFNQLSRMFMKKMLFPLPGSHLVSYPNYFGHAVAKVYIPDTVANIEATQNAKAKKRAENVKKKIQDLKDPPPPREKKGEE